MTASHVSGGTQLDRRDPGAIRVMVVDDHDLVRESVRAVLRASGMVDVVACCGDGQQAVELFRTHRPDVVLMDLAMPVMGGAEATRRIMVINPDAAVVVLTATRTGEAIDEARSAGARSVIFKGTAVRDLLAVVTAAAATGAAGGTSGNTPRIGESE